MEKLGIPDITWKIGTAPAAPLLSGNSQRAGCWTWLEGRFWGGGILDLSHYCVACWSWVLSVFCAQLRTAPSRRAHALTKMCVDRFDSGPEGWTDWWERWFWLSAPKQDVFSVLEKRVRCRTLKLSKVIQVPVTSGWYAYPHTFRPFDSLGVLLTSK